MANRLNKHYKKHFKFTNICSECGKGFQFPKQLTIHERKHTNSRVGKFVCPTGGCNKVLLSKESLKAYQRIHKGLKFECDICGKKDFDTVLHLKQHKLGKHGNGTIAFCGKKFQWPDTKYRHQGICDTCKDIKRKMVDKPDLPNPIFRCRKKKLFMVISAENRLNKLFCKYSILFYGTFLWWAAMCMCDWNWITFCENGLFCLKVDSGLSFRITKWILYFEKSIKFHWGLKVGLLFSAK